ncbi:hypothetical protein ZWY2020_001888 [Hordeum vulgare]|nr:hypothetical protein ZWY2020_001888 [Hordeum vulgare]
MCATRAANCLHAYSPSASRHHKSFHPSCPSAPSSSPAERASERDPNQFCSRSNSAPPRLASPRKGK